jgi:hypothetical protein
MIATAIILTRTHVIVLTWRLFFRGCFAFFSASRIGVPRLHFLGRRIMICFFFLEWHILCCPLLFSHSPSLARYKIPNCNPHYLPTYLLFLTSVAWVNKHISHSLMTMLERLICRSKQQSGITAVFPGEAVCMQATKMAHRIREKLMMAMLDRCRSP